MSQHQPKNILIVSPSAINISETFIKAHLDKLKGNIFFIYGNNLNYAENGINLTELNKPRRSNIDRLLNILPYFLVFRIKIKSSKKYLPEHALRKYIQDKQIDIVLAEYGTSGAYLTPVCKELNIPLVVHFHGFDASRYEVLNKFRSRYLEMFTYAKAIIGVSDRMIEDLKNMGCSSQKLLINPYGPNNKFLNIECDIDSPAFLTIGRMVEKKAPYLTILAFKKVLQNNPDAKLLMVGDGPLLGVCKNLVTVLQMANNIQFFGSQSSEDILEIMKSAFCFLQHSIIADDGDSEGTPVSILEAAAAGLPVISTKHAGIPEAVIHEQTGYLTEEKDIEKMAFYMNLLFNNRVLCKTLGQNAKEHIAIHYSFEKHIANIQRAIDNC